MSFYVVTHPDGVDEFKLGDKIPEAKALTYLNSPYADRVTVFPDAAQPRHDMQDATPSKPIGSIPHDLPIKGYHPQLKVGAISESSPVYLGDAASANPAIRNPNLNERLRDANPGYQDQGTATSKGETDLVTPALKDAWEEPMEKAAPVSTESKVVPAAKVQLSAEAAQEKA